MASNSEITKKRKIPRRLSPDLNEKDNGLLTLSLSTFRTTPRAGILSPVLPQPPPVMLDLSRFSGDLNPQLALQLSPPHSTVIVTGENPSISAPTVTLPYHYQEEGLYTVPHSPTLNLPPPSTAENQSLPSQLSPLIATGENPSVSAPTVTLPYHRYQEDGLSTVPHKPTLNLPPPSTAENQPLSFQHSPSHQPLSVTGENPSLSAPTVTLPYQRYREDGASGGAVTPRLPRPRRNSLQSPREGKSATVPAPFPWATNYRATVHSLNYLLSKQIFSIIGEVQCKRCEKKFEIEFDLRQKFMEVGTFIAHKKAGMHDRAPLVWINPILPTCIYCNQENSAKPIISEKKKFINWLFLLLGQMLGCCTLDQLKYFCKHTKNHRTGAKDRVLYLAYLGLCKQLDPNGPFDR
ncbi:Uncharacterized protein Adt_43585 [Abeliophyllum distichum]|uniref:DUF7086 domain-containing protein n=1 Tax=Abeliophyllum distichum TaxID=126358 RepID=A0ABD1P8H6_9LAMI